MKLLGKSKSMRGIGLLLKVNKSMIIRVASRSSVQKSVHRKAGSDRIRKTPARQDRRMLKWVKNDPQKPAVDVAIFANEQMGVSIGVQTARRRLCEANLHARRPAKQPMISRVSKKNRLDFAKRYHHWKSEQRFKIFRWNKLHSTTTQSHISP